MSRSNQSIGAALAACEASLPSVVRIGRSQRRGIMLRFGHVSRVLRLVPLTVAITILPFAGRLQGLAVAGDAGESERSVEGRSGPGGEKTPEFEVLNLRGQVVWLADAMARLHGVKTVPEARTRVLALETAGGDLYPLAEDIRGRGFRRDERLRDRPVELTVRKYYGAPVIQVIRAFEVRGEQRFELDYWCDICAIAMFELKPCDCCQADIVLRRRLVGPDGRVRD